MSASAVPRRVAVIGAGVSGLTCGVLFAERGFRTAILAEQIGQQTTSGAAGALWFPYDAEPIDKVISWALATYKVLVDLSKDPRTGVSMNELRQYCRAGEIEIPDWARSLGASVMSRARRAVAQRRRKVETSLTISASAFKSGFSINVPLMDTTIYLDYLADRFRKAGGEIKEGVRLEKFEDVDPKFDLAINCAGVGARELAHDVDLEPHRGQVAIVPKIDNLNYAVVCDDAPLMYAIPRTNDCVFGGTNEVSDNLEVDPTSTSRIVAECSRVLEIGKPRVLHERVGLRPFRKLGVRLEREKLRDGHTVIHNYGHGGSGFTLSWGCAQEVLAFASFAQSRP
ncbi:MAG TPA: FAD-dependent oxidoreductase [Chthoniobacterales bacterium]|nr:FAD-dependent oxidoreductase [Chthoniobacterales bacterium]